MQVNYDPKKATVKQRLNAVINSILGRPISFSIDLAGHPKEELENLKKEIENALIKK